MEETPLYFKSEDILKKILKEPFKFQKIDDKLIVKKERGNGFRSRPTSFIFPRIIKIKSSTAGLIVGEGYIGSSFIFCNSNEKIIINILNFLSQFDVKAHFSLEVAMKNMEKEFIETSKKKWENIIKEEIKKIRIRNEFNNTTEKGNIHISIYNIIFSKVLKKIVEGIKDKSEEDKEIAKNYLKGILAAEGNINVKRTTTNCLYMVRISAKKVSEREHYKRVLKNIGINIYCKDMPTISKEEGSKLGWKTTKGRAGAVLISRWENFLKILLLDLLELHKDKRQKFARHFIYNKFTKQFLSFGSFINKEFTMIEAKNKFHLKANSIRGVKTLAKQGYISKKLVNKNNRLISYYTLTPRYIKTYDKLKQELSI